jgi:hypothetical protein
MHTDLSVRFGKYSYDFAKRAWFHIFHHKGRLTTRALNRWCVCAALARVQHAAITLFEVEQRGKPAYLTGIVAK